MCKWLEKAIVRRVIASLGRQKGRHNFGSCFIGSDLMIGGFWSAWAAAQIHFLHLKFVADAGRFAYWLGKLVDASRKSENMAPSKLTLSVFVLVFFAYLLLCCFKTFP